MTLTKNLLLSFWSFLSLSVCLSVVPYLSSVCLSVCLSFSPQFTDGPDRRRDKSRELGRSGSGPWCGRGGGVRGFQPAAERWLRRALSCDQTVS